MDEEKQVENKTEPSWLKSVLMGQKMDEERSLLKDSFWYLWFLTFASLIILSLYLIEGIPRMWKENVFELFWPLSYFQFILEVKIDLKGEEMLIETAIAGLMGGIGSIIYCMWVLFGMLMRKLGMPGYYHFPPLKIGEFALFLPRPFFGILLAIIFFFLVKAGMVVISGAAPFTVNVDKIDHGALDAARASAGGLGGLVGMFAEQAMHRLIAVANALFMPAGPGPGPGPAGTAETPK